MPVNEGSVFASWFQSVFSRKVDDSIDHAHCSSQCHAVVSEEDNLPRIPGKVIEFENEIIHPGETLLYTNEGMTSLARVLDVFVDPQGVLRIKLLCTSGKEVVTTQQSVRSPDNPDIGWIPASVPDLRNTSSLLSDEELKKIASPPTLSPSQQLFLSWHHRLNHLPFQLMLRLAQMGILPKQFLKLKNDLPPCVSCQFGKAHRKPWRSKTSKSGKLSTLRGPDPLEPGEMIAVDQLISAQPGLVPQELGSMTRSRIWAATIFVDFATRYVYVALMRDQSGEATLEAKAAFEHHCATPEV